MPCKNKVLTPYIAIQIVLGEIMKDIYGMKISPKYGGDRNKIFQYNMW